MKKAMTVAVLAASLAGGSADAATDPPIYSFGDSLSDVGNDLVVSTILGKPVPLPAYYFEGRFSNGLNWVDDLTNKLVGTYATPFLAGGNDFAFGGAQTGPTNVNPGLPIDLVDQVAAFHAQVPSPASDALYTLDIGANDIGSALVALAANPAFDLSTFLSAAVTNTVWSIAALYSFGARDLLYYEVPDLSVVPAFEAAGPVGGALAMAFNEAVLSAVNNLDLPGLTVFDVPIFKAIDVLVNYPGRYGFTNATDPCFSGSFDTAGTACSNPDQYVFWDHEHPTAAANALTADLAYAVLTGRPNPIVAPEPSTWAMILIGFGGLGLAGWRARRPRTGQCLLSASA
jgi:outer membrane lipase/esterase